MSSPAAVSARISLFGLFGIFFKIACTSFGGFMAMISVVQNEVVERRRLMRHDEFVDGISLASILPGPVAVNLVVYVGYRLRGGWGALISATGAVLPSFLLIVLLGYFYFRYGQLPAVGRMFAGFVPAMAAIVLVAAWSMSRKAVDDGRGWALAAAAAALLLWIGGVWSTLAIVFGSGLIGAVWYRDRANSGKPVPPRKHRHRGPGAQLFLFAAMTPMMAFEPNVLAKLFAVFAGMSVMLFGGGYVFIPLIQEIVVDGQGWVSSREFIDAIAMGQITPGPILVSAAVIGLKVAGLAGAVVATVGIYLPPALLMVAGSRALSRLQNARAAQAALKGIRAAVAGMIFAAAYVVASTAEPAWGSAAIFAGALYALWRFQVAPVWIVPISGALGLVLY